MPCWKVRAIEQTGQAPQKVGIVCRALENKIRHRDSLTVRRELLVLIPTIAKAWGARYDISEVMLTEAIRIIFAKFSFLAVEEIREAYRQWGAGEIKVRGAEQYGGEFSCASMSKILSAYNEERKLIAAEILKQKAIHKEEKEAEEKRQKMRKKFDIEFPQLIEAAKTKYKSWKEIPEFWFKAAWKRNMIRLSNEEIKAIEAEAIELAKIQVQIDDYYQGMQKSIKDWINRNQVQENLVKSIARKLSVWKKLINPPTDGKSN